MKEQRKVSREEGAIAPLPGENLTWSLRLESAEEGGIGIADEMMARQLAPFKVVEAGINLLAIHRSDPVVNELQVPDMATQSSAA